MDHAARLQDEITEFADLVFAADLQTPVPTCPEWTLNQLFRHVGRGIRWAAENVTGGLNGPADPKAVRDGRPPTEPQAARRWVTDGAQVLLEAVARTGPDTEVWTFGGPKPARWWIRRWVHEIAVHRADAAIALDVEFALAPAQAADALSEWFDLVTRVLPELGERTVHLHATDDGLDPQGSGPFATAPGATNTARPMSRYVGRLPTCCWSPPGAVRSSTPRCRCSAPTTCCAPGWT